MCNINIKTSLSKGANKLFAFHSDAFFMFDFKADARKLIFIVP